MGIDDFRTYFRVWNNVWHATGATFSCLSIIPLELSKLGSPEQNNLGKVNLDSFLISVKARYLNRFFWGAGCFRFYEIIQVGEFVQKWKKLRIFKGSYVYSLLHIFFVFLNNMPLYTQVSIKVDVFREGHKHLINSLNFV